MNFKQAQLIGEFKREIKERFPHVTILNHYEATEEVGIAIRVASEKGPSFMERESRRYFGYWWCAPRSL